MRFSTSARISPWSAAITLVVAFFLASTLPAITRPPSRENATERQGQTAGMIRIYCQDSSRHFLHSPQLPFGRHPFNLEFSFFEWMQGRVAATFDGPRCDSVEPVARTINIAVSALSIYFIFLLGQLLLSPLAGFLGGLLLATDYLWMKFATFTMVDNRMILCGLMAMYFSLIRKGPWAALFWFLCLTQKPQAFAFIGPFFVVLTLVHPAFSKIRRSAYGWLAIALGLGAVYYIYSVKLNAAHDVPWLTWSGPRSQRWFFGEWSERFEFIYYKNLVFDWMKKSGFIYAAPAFGVVAFFKPVFRKPALYLSALTLTLPFLSGRFLNTFIFYNVFKAHDYYALPVNAFSALTRGLIYGFFIEKALSLTLKSALRQTLILPLLIGGFVVPLAKDLSRYYQYLHGLTNPLATNFEPEWDLKLFPTSPSKPSRFVVVANQGRDYIYLYFSKQQGHIWCAKNKKFAPRAFWKAEGVEYVAWAEGIDPSTKRMRWTVRTLDEELAFARKQGWSSDVNDMWSGHTMSEWAQQASRTFRDPCARESDFDPRQW